MPRSTGSKRTASAASSGRSSGASDRARFTLCLDADGHEGSLVRGKLYRVASPESGDRETDLRIVDEEGESYLYDRRRFQSIPLPASVRLALASS